MGPIDLIAFIDLIGLYRSIIDIVDNWIIKDSHSYPRQ